MPCDPKVPKCRRIEHWENFLKKQKKQIGIKIQSL